MEKTSTSFYDAAEMRMSNPIPFTEAKENGETEDGVIPGELESTLVPIIDEPYEEALKIVQRDRK